MTHSSSPSESSLPKLIFMGTPLLAASALKALHEAGYPIVAVYTQPPKPVGRGYKLTPSPVHDYAESLGIPVYTPKSLRQPEIQEEFRAHGADLAIVAAYGLILPTQILETPTHGCLNIHFSLLPRWRGAAPIQRSIMAGDTQTGITIMKMDEGLDTGPIISQATVEITAETTAQTLHDTLTELGADLLLKTIPGYLDGSLPLREQPTEGITYAAKLSKEDSQLDWRRTAIELHQQIRGLSPWPGTYFMHGDDCLKISQAEIVHHIETQSGMPGEILDNRLTIACGQGALRPLKIQKPGGKWLSVDEFLRGYPLSKGMHLSCPATN